MYYGHSTSRAHFKSYVAGRGRVALQQDRAYRFAIYDPPEAQIYNYGTIYCKGACVLHMLRYVMGDTAWEQPGVFFRALRVYADSFRYGTASTADYQRINERLSGLDLAWFFDDWVYQAGIPRYSLSWRREPAGDSFRVIMTLSQNNGANAPNCFRMPIPVRVNCGAERQFVTLRPQANPETDTFVVAAWPDSLSWDPDDWVLDSVAVTGIEEDPSPKLQVPIAVRSSPARGIVRFELPAGQVKSVAVYDESGREAAVLNAGSRSEVAWRPGRAGVYFAQAKGSGLRTRFVVVE
jgi:hypothetical protein